jgi:hypothetical protein
VANGGGSYVPIASARPVLDLWRQDGKAFIASCDSVDCRMWSIRHWQDGKFVPDAAIPSEGETLVAADSQGGSSVLLTPTRILEFRGVKVTEQELAEPLKTGPVDAVLFSTRGIYLGLNAGEWGGGLKFVDRATGRIAAVEKNNTGALCGGPLNTGCDPVTGLAAEPWRPGCVAAAIGLVHMSPHGRVIEVCGRDVKRIYFKPYGEQPSRASLNDGEPFSTVAFFGLQAKGQSLWAVGIDGIYEIREDGVKAHPLPAFQKVGGFSVSFTDPDVILVLTDINQRRSLSGSVPLLVPR